jgi:hypothetical protein
MTEFQEIKHLFDITENNGFSEEEILAHKNVCEHIPKFFLTITCN